MSVGAKLYETPDAGPDNRRTGAAAKAAAAKLFTMIFVGAVVGGLIAGLGGYQFRLYVRMIKQNSVLHASVTDIAAAVRPIAWFFPMIFGIYQCIRSKASFEYVLALGLIGGGFGWGTSSYVTADPGPSFHSSIYNVPIGCFAGTCTGALAQAIRWARNNEA
jgi:hypothetical protein